MGGFRNGARMGNAIARWKEKNAPYSRTCQILAKLAGFIGGAIEVVAILGLLLSMAMEKGPDFFSMILLWLGGNVIDIGGHWLIKKLDDRLCRK